MHDVVRFPLRRGVLTYNGATPWFTTVAIGQPAQPMRMMVDTGTLNTWVTGIACDTTACTAHRRFNPAASRTWHPFDRPPHEVDFGPWGKMTVQDGQDVFGLVEDGQSFVEPVSLEVATHYEGAQFQALDADGGLAVPSVPDSQSTALLEGLRASGRIQQRIATFDVDPIAGEGEVVMGALDPARFDPTTLQTVPLCAAPQGLDYLWCVTLEGLTCNGTTLFAGYPFCLDTGSSCFKGSQATIDLLRATVTGNGTRPDVIQSASQLADYPTLWLSIQGQDYAMAPQDYFLQLASGVWVLGFQVLNGLPDAFLLVGSIFLDKLYVAFDFDGRTVSFATPLPRKLPVDSALSGTWKNEFGSTIEVGPIGPDGTFRGLYRSSTGATGCYPVMGVADPYPLAGGQTVSFSVSWRSLEGSYDPSWHWVSAFAGTLTRADNGTLQLATQYLLVQDPSAAADWMATAVYPSTFIKQ